MTERVKVCFLCKEFIAISTTDFKLNEELHNFEWEHRGHSVQVINIDELKRKDKFNKSYTRIFPT